MSKIKFLNSVQLKYFLALMMVFNHINEFFGFTGKIPKAFELIGYCVAPCFLLLMVDGYQLTSNRKKYYSRLWMIAAMMGIVLWIVKNMEFAKRSDGFVLLNGIIQNFLILFVLMVGVDNIQAKKYLKGILIFIAPFVWGIGLTVLANIFPQSKVTLELIHSVVFPNTLWVIDGNITYVLTGLVAYLLRKNRNVQVIGSMISIYLFRTIYQIIVRVLIRGGEFSGNMFLNEVNISAAIGFLPILFYNGKKGKGSTKFFYYFYPLHIYVLYALSGVVFEMINPGDNQIEKVTIPMLGIAIAFAGVFFIKDHLLANKQKKDVSVNEPPKIQP